MRLVAVVSVHCHNDLGLAVANSLAAVQAGATQVECTVGGIGERAGNCALEEFVMASRVRRDIYGVDTNVDATQIVNSSEMLSRMCSQPVPVNKPIVGRNAFAHASGVHQDGVLKFRSTYEIMKPEDVGRRGSEIILTARSGRNALVRRMRELNISFDPDHLEVMFQKFKSVADSRVIVSDQDLRNLL
jgi:2-isopropylmalate synthase